MNDIRVNTRAELARPSSRFYMSFLIAIVLALFSYQALADVIIDNDQVGTSSTGTWAVSGGSDPYGSESLWARSGATYTWTANSLPAGLYDVQMWWTEWPSRSTAAPVQITHADGSFNTTVNQQADGGQWNSLGQFYFDGSGSVRLSAPNPYPTSYCADAVQFVLLQAGPRPVASIDLIDPSPAASSEVVTFNGSATDDGFVLVPQDSLWESNIDGELGHGLTLDIALTDGVHTISFKVQDADGLWSVAAEEVLVVGDEPDEYIIDNDQAGTSSTGTWQPSGASGYYGDESLWSRNGATYTWSFTPPIAGSYEVFMWWTEWPSRSTAAPIQITYAGGVFDTTVNQQINGGGWNSLGIFNFDGSGSVRLSAPNPYPTSYCADAVKFVKVDDSYIIAGFEASTTSGDMPLTVNFTDLSTASATIDTWQWDFENDGTIDSTDPNPAHQYAAAGVYTVRLVVSSVDGSDTEIKTDYIEVVDPSTPVEFIIDNDEQGTSKTGTWLPSGASGYYGIDSLYGRDGATYTWTFNSVPTGTYEAFMWWTQWPSRSTAAPIRITHATGFTDTTVNQQTNGGDWYSLGQFYFDGTAIVRLSAPDAYPTSYSADAVKLVPASSDPLPVAAIVSIDPASANLGDEVVFTGQGDDSAGGTITTYEWTSNIDDLLSSSGVPSFSTTTLSEGVHEISLRVKNDSDVWSSPATSSVEIINPSANIERIFCCFGYYGSDQRSQLTNYLNSIADYQGNDIWNYVTSDKTYIITYVDTIEGMKTALRTPDSHLLYSGHSNYGLGPLFSTIEEVQAQEINDVYYVDDPRILNISSDYVHVSVSGMRTGQAYPFWWPVYQDGTSALAPYTFDDPAGDPAYNYYITYQVPGDPTCYKVDTSRNDPIQRYWGTSVEPWYSATGEEPDPNDPTQQQYFITNDAYDYDSIQSTGEWVQSKDGVDFFKENYWYSQPGSGENEMSFKFVVHEAGSYDIYAWWPEDGAGTTVATYTVNYEGGSNDVTVDQSVSSGGWYLLGQYPFDVGYYSVSLNNGGADGLVLADAIKVAHPDTPPEAISADFVAASDFATLSRMGPAPLKVSFINTSIGDLTGRTWNFGDGFTNTSRDSIDHTYTQPGFYTVTLTASGPGGSNTITKTDYIWVTSSTEPPFQVDFVSLERSGNPPLGVSLMDISTGNISSWLWDFGDGTTSTQAQPYHLYTDFGNYDVSLTATDADTNEIITVTKENFVRVSNEESIDNVDYPLGHFGSYGKNIVRIREQEVPRDEIKCKRVFYYSCNSGNYYLDVFKHNNPVVFYTLNTSDMTSGKAFFIYLYSYFNGYSDNLIYQTLQSKEAVFDYYDFSKRPNEQQ